MEINTIIIEDEQAAIELLKYYLNNNSEINLLNIYHDGFSGLKAINELKPDLVFLDIQMPKLTGLELIELIDYTPLIIFTTAYDEYAIKAFELSAVDYLLKPFSESRLMEAIQKVKIRIQNKKPIDFRNINTVAYEYRPINRIAIKNKSKIIIVPVNEIVYFEAEDDYVMIYTDKNKYLKQGTMKYFESVLNKNEFVRIHRSYIIRMNQIQRLEPFESSRFIAILKNGAKLPVSKTGLKSLKEKLNF